MLRPITMYDSQDFVDELAIACGEPDNGNQIMHDLFWDFCYNEETGNGGIGYFVREVILEWFENPELDGLYVNYMLPRTLNTVDEDTLCAYANFFIEFGDNLADDNDEWWAFPIHFNW